MRGKGFCSAGGEERRRGGGEGGRRGSDRRSTSFALVDKWVTCVSGPECHFCGKEVENRYLKNHVENKHELCISRQPGQSVTCVSRPECHMCGMEVKQICLKTYCHLCGKEVETICLKCHILWIVEPRKYSKLFLSLIS